MMRPLTFTENMAASYVEYFNENGEEKTFDFVLKTNVALSVLGSLYSNFMKDGVTPMENISKEKKEKYWLTACKYYEELPERLKASKAVYVLELITSTF